MLALAPIPSEVSAYISWQSALAFYGLTEQLPLDITVAISQQRRPRQIANTTVRYILQSEARRYGIARFRLSGGDIRIATKEKAVLDSLDHPDLAGGLSEVVKALHRGVDYKELVKLARRHPSRTLVARLGYLMSVLGIGDPSPLLRRLSPDDRPFLLDASDPKTSYHQVDRRWKIIDNVGPFWLHEWAAA